MLILSVSFEVLFVDAKLEGELGGWMSMVEGPLDQ